MLSKLKRQKEVTRIKRSKAIAKKFFALSEVKRAKQIMFYLSLADEVKTYGMIEGCLKKGKQVSVPAIIKNKQATESKDMWPCQITDMKDNLIVGLLGIKQPRRKKLVALDKIDLVVVPALAFDLEKHRLGRGRGYYDKFLSRLPENIYKVGLAFKFQVLKKLPHQPHDLCVDKVIAA